MESRKENFFIMRLIILVILLIILIICSFKTGQKYFLLKHTYFDTTISETNSQVARWYFNARIIK